MTMDGEDGAGGAPPEVVAQCRAVGEWVRRWLYQTGLKKKELAERGDPPLTESYLGVLERGGWNKATGQYQLVSQKYIDRIARAFALKDEALYQRIRREGMVARGLLEVGPQFPPEVEELLRRPEVRDLLLRIAEQDVVLAPGGRARLYTPDGRPLRLTDQVLRRLETEAQLQQEGDVDER